jgi:hypothetical protein
MTGKDKIDSKPFPIFQLGEKESNDGIEQGCNQKGFNEPFSVHNRVAHVGIRKQRNPPSGILHAQVYIFSEMRLHFPV